MNAQETMALIAAYGRAVREHLPPDQVLAAHDAAIRALAGAGVGQRYASNLTRYIQANERQANRDLEGGKRVAAGHEAVDIFNDLQRAVREALGEQEPAPPAPPASGARTGRARPAHGRG